MYASFDEVPSFKGASTHILSGLRSIVRQKTVHLVTLGSVAIRPNAGLHHHPLHIREQNVLKRGLAFREQVRSLARRLKPDLVHFRSPWEGIALLDVGRPSIYEVNGLPSVELPYYYRTAPTHVIELLRKWEQQCLERASVIICPSAKIASYLEKSFTIPSATPVHVLPNAYDPVPHSFLRPEISSSDRPIRLVYLGTLSPWQGISWSLKAIAVVAGMCTLDVYAPQSKHVSRKFLRRIKRLELNGLVTVHEPMHRRAMLDILPKYDFGFAPFIKTVRNVEQGCFPLKLLEYLSHGIPLLTSNLAICRQLATDNKNALLFHPNSTQSLVAALRSVDANRNLLAALRKQAIASLKTHWTWEDYGARLEQIYSTAGKNRF